MTSIRLSAALRCILSGMILSCGALFIGGVVGCQSQPKTVDPQVAAPEKVASVRETIQKNQPGSLVGQVIETYQQYAAVGDIAVQDVKVGQTITFLDADGNPINNGSIKVIVGDTLHVKFDATGKRPVQKGDLALWLKE